MAEDCLSGKHGGRVATRFPPEPNGYLPHRPCQVDLPELRRRRGDTAAPATCDSTTPTRPRKTSSTSTRSKEDVAWLGFKWDALLFASGLLRAALPVRGRADHARQGATSTASTADEIRAHRGTLTEPGQEQPVPRPPGRGKPRSVRADARRRIRGRRARAAREDRHGVARTSTCAIRRSTGSATPRTTGPATPGASIRCTTSRIRCRTRSSASRIRSARWSSRITGRSTTGCVDDAHHDDGDRPQQIEFARLNLNYTVMSKRKLLQLVQQRHVVGLGRSAHADDQRPAAPAATRPSRSAISARGSASPRKRTSSTSRSSSTASART